MFAERRRTSSPFEVFALLVVNSACAALVMPVRVCPLQPVILWAGLRHSLIFIGGICDPASPPCSCQRSYPRCLWHAALGGASRAEVGADQDQRSKEHRDSQARRRAR